MRRGSQVLRRKGLPLLVHLFTFSVAIRRNDQLLINMCHTKNCDLGERQLVMEAQAGFRFPHLHKQFPLSSGGLELIDCNSLERKGGDELGRAAVYAGHLAWELE